MDNSIAVYTALRLLQRMKNQLGLEAMIEYIDIYINVVNKENENLKKVVDMSINVVDINKIYQQVRRNND